VGLHPCRGGPASKRPFAGVLTRPPREGAAPLWGAYVQARQLYVRHRSRARGRSGGVPPVLAITREWTARLHSALGHRGSQLLAVAVTHDHDGKHHARLGPEDGRGAA
jgi:hypothetical protein